MIPRRTVVLAPILALPALVLAQAALEKFGGDSVTETSDNLAGYVKRVAARGVRS